MSEVGTPTDPRVAAASNALKAALDALGYTLWQQGAGPATGRVHIPTLVAEVLKYADAAALDGVGIPRETGTPVDVPVQEESPPLAVSGSRLPRCDHICMLDEGHVERGELHQYGYEIPSPRAALDGVSPKPATRDALKALIDPERPWVHDEGNHNCGECWECIAGTMGIARLMFKSGLDPRPAIDTRDRLIHLESALAEAYGRLQNAGLPVGEYIEKAFAAAGLDSGTRYTLVGWTRRRESMGWGYSFQSVEDAERYVVQEPQESDGWHAVFIREQGEDA